LKKRWAEVELVFMVDHGYGDFASVYRIKPKDDDVRCSSCMDKDDRVAVMEYDAEKGLYVCQCCGATKTREEATLELAERSVMPFNAPDYVWSIGSVYTLWKGGFEEISIGPSVKAKLLAFSMVGRYNPVPALVTLYSGWGTPRSFLIALKANVPSEVVETLKILERAGVKRLTQKDMDELLGNPTPEKVKSVLALKALLHDVQRR
jgi:hypothetical protein